MRCNLPQNGSIKLILAIFSEKSIMVEMDHLNAKELKDFFTLPKKCAQTNYSFNSLSLKEMIMWSYFKCFATSRDRKWEINNFSFAVNKKDNFLYHGYLKIKGDQLIGVLPRTFL